MRNSLFFRLPCPPLAKRGSLTHSQALALSKRARDVTAPPVALNRCALRLAGHQSPRQFFVRDGTMTQHRFLLEVGAHARPYNRCSIGICYEGGLDEHGKPCDSCSRKRRLWGIETCLGLHRRSVLAWMLMHFSGG